MITAITFLIAFLLVVLVVRGTGGGILTAVERAFLLSAPLPVILALLLPASLTMLHAGTVGGRRFAELLSQTGLWLSGGLVLVGAWLLQARRRNGKPRDFRLAVGVLLAALPALLAVIVALLYMARP
jgi:hypothetical protein